MHAVLLQGICDQAWDGSEGHYSLYLSVRQQQRKALQARQWPLQDSAASVQGSTQCMSAAAYGVVYDL
jgi:hypothetical protein